ncbi:hypothetical protein DIPPA_01509 [Diplonema papillatum]|nr:hypothetical protein DIPPA_01509 [Diplonema papillatum]
MAVEFPRDNLSTLGDLPPKNPFKYTDGNLAMMKEYGMSEAEFAEEFGGRPHQQRQSPVARTDLERLRVPMNAWDYCSHKYIPLMLCWESMGGYYANPNTQCKNHAHEYELCQAAELIRQNQVLQLKKGHHAAYSNEEKNWLFNDPNWGHMIWRTKYGFDSFKGRMMMGGGSRVVDPPTHETTMAENPKYDPDIVRSDPHPFWWLHKVGKGMGVGWKFYWNRAAIQSPLYGAKHDAIDCVVPFDPLQDGAIMKPW